MIRKLEKVENFGFNFLQWIKTDQKNIWSPTSARLSIKCILTHVIVIAKRLNCDMQDWLILNSKLENYAISKTVN